MEKQLQCIKIKDGLYLGNFKTAQDAQFLVTNKFSYIINCSAEIPNYYEGQGLKYLKFKLIKDKPHKLWDETMKKLKKLDKFIQTCQQNSLCCLIHSYDGVNRSLVMLVAFLMNRYRWRLGKVLEFIRSKSIFIGLSEHYIEQLEMLEEFLGKSEPELTSDWRIQYRSVEEEILSKTFLNSQEIQNKEPTKRQKKERRVVWKDLAQKEKKKQQRALIKEQQKERGLKSGAERDQKQKQRTKIDLSKLEQKDIVAKLQKKPKTEQPQLSSQSQPTKQKQKQSQKKLKPSTNKSKPQIILHESQKQNQRSADKCKQKQKQMQKNKPSLKAKDINGGGQDPDSDIDQDQIIHLIAKNLKSKKKIETGVIGTADQNEERVYNVTINNYIKPNINILSSVPVGGKKMKKRPQSAWKKNKPL